MSFFKNVKKKMQDALGDDNSAEPSTSATATSTGNGSGAAAPASPSLSVRALCTTLPLLFSCVCNPPPNWFGSPDRCPCAILAMPSAFPSTTCPIWPTLCAA